VHFNGSLSAQFYPSFFVLLQDSSSTRTQLALVYELPFVEMLNTHFIISSCKN
jgi:hypothetical protein